MGGGCSPWICDKPVIITASSAARTLPLGLVFICRASQLSQNQGPSAVSAFVLCRMLLQHVLLSTELTQGKANVQSPRTSHLFIGGDRQHSQVGLRVLLPKERVAATQGSGKGRTGGSHKKSHLPDFQVLFWEITPWASLQEPHKGGQQCATWEASSILTLTFILSLHFQIPSLSLHPCFLSILLPPSCFGTPLSPFFSSYIPFICPTWAGWFAPTPTHNPSAG